MAEIVTAARALVAGRLVADAWIAIDDAHVAAIGTGPPPASATWHLADGVLAPGLVDAQLNGAFGVDLVDADDAAWSEVLAALPSTGVTACVPTFITAPVPVLAARLRAARHRARTSGPTPAGARSLGIHVEGPFLAASRRGAHDERHLQDPAPDAVAQLLDAGDGALAYVTLAPERPGALEAIATFVAAGVRVAVGHSDATDTQVTAAMDAGATLVTHLYNAQRPLGHRDPGVVGAALTDPRVTCGLIVDLHHVAPTAVRLAFGAASGRVMLVTDAMAALGMPPGTYQLGGATTQVRADTPPVREDGTIAGSALRLDEAVGNAIRCGIEPALALEAATRVPADALGRPDLGRIEVGASADLVWLDDAWRAARTWVGGQVRHDRQEVA